MAKKAKPYKYIAPKLPEVSPEEVRAREKSLRAQIDSASYLQGEKEELKERLPWLYALFFPKQRKKFQKQP